MADPDVIPPKNTTKNKHALDLAQQRIKQHEHNAEALELGFTKAIGPFAKGDSAVNRLTAFTNPPGDSPIELEKAEKTSFGSGAEDYLSNTLGYTDDAIENIRMDAEQNELQNNVLDLNTIRTLFQEASGDEKIEDFVPPPTTPKNQTTRQKADNIKSAKNASAKIEDSNLQNAYNNALKSLGNSEAGSELHNLNLAMRDAITARATERNIKIYDDNDEPTDKEINDDTKDTQPPTTIQQEKKQEDDIANYDKNIGNVGEGTGTEKDIQSVINVAQQALSSTGIVDDDTPPVIVGGGGLGVEQQGVTPRNKRAVPKSQMPNIDRLLSTELVDNILTQATSSADGELERRRCSSRREI